MTGDNHEDFTAREAVADARREVARAQARLAEVAVRYADARIAEETTATPEQEVPGFTRPKPGEFVADELSVMLRDQPSLIAPLAALAPRGSHLVAAYFVVSRGRKACPLTPPQHVGARSEVRCLLAGSPKPPR